MDSVVQLIRNTLCVTKDLGWFRNTVLWDSNIPVRYYKLDEPFNKTTPLEVMISIAQTYVIYSGIPNSIRMIYTNYLKLQRIQRLITNESKSRTGPPTDIDRILYNALLKEANNALKSIFIGFNVFCIAGSFVWLAGNSWHVTETDIIGGLPGLIHALTVMNTCLTPLLFYMYQDATNYLYTAKQMEILSEKIKLQQQQPGTTEKDSTTDKSTTKKFLLFDARTIDLPTFELLGQTISWKPFWSNDDNIKSILAETIEEKQLLQQEKDKIRNILASFCNNTAVDDTTKSSSSNDKQNKSVTSSTGTTSRYLLVQDTVNEFETSIPILRFQGYREFIYLIINFIAWYGYGVCILVYYYNYDEAKQPTYIRRIFLNLSNTDIDFYGNLAGDCMWTLEPIIALSTPYYIEYLRKKRTTTKTTATAKAKTE